MAAVAVLPEGKSVFGVKLRDTLERDLPGGYIRVLDFSRPPLCREGLRIAVNAHLGEQGFKSRASLSFVATDLLKAEAMPRSPSSVA